MYFIYQHCNTNCVWSVVVLDFLMPCINIVNHVSIKQIDFN